MAEELAPSNPSPSIIRQNGAKNTAIVANEGTIININNPVTLANGFISTQPSAQQMISIASFATDYYNLIVTTDPDVFENNLVHMMASRALSKSYVPDSILQFCSSLTPEGKKFLLTLPAIICQENTGYEGKTDENQLAIYARITHILPSYGNIDIVFEPIRAFPQRLMCEPLNAAFFGIEINQYITTLNHTAWHVIQRNLFDAFDQAGLADMPHPELGGN